MNKSFSLPILSFLSVILSASCSHSEEPILFDMSSNNSESTISVEFGLNPPETENTRCFDSDTHKFSQTPSLNDGCMTKAGFKSLYLIILNDGIPVYSGTLIENDTYPSFSRDGYVESFESTSSGPSKLVLRFSSELDPSKIELIVSGGNYDELISDNWDSNKWQFQNTANFDETFISNKVISSYCNFYKRHKLATENNWSKIDKKITLTRLNSDFIFLTSVKECGAREGRQTFIYSSPNTDEGIGKFKNNLMRTEDAAEYATGTYYIKNDIAKFKQGQICIHTSTTFGEAFNNVWNEKNNNTGAVEATNARKVRYNNKDYYFMTYFSMIASPTKKYVQTTDGTEIKYLSIIRREFTRKQSESDDLKTFWTSLPMPSGGIKANTRYIYIFNNPSTLWVNESKYNDIVFESGAITKSTEPESNFNWDGIQLIEQSMDDPLPLEMIEL